MSTSANAGAVAGTVTSAVTSAVTGAVASAVAGIMARCMTRGLGIGASDIASFKFAFEEVRISMFCETLGVGERRVDCLEIILRHVPGLVARKIMMIVGKIGASGEILFAWSWLGVSGPELLCLLTTVSKLLFELLSVISSCSLQIAVPGLFLDPFGQSANQVGGH